MGPSLKSLLERFGGPMQLKEAKNITNAGFYSSCLRFQGHQKKKNNTKQQGLTHFDTTPAMFLVGHEV